MVAINRSCKNVDEKVEKRFSDSKIDHARLRDNNSTEKLTNIIIEEGKIVQYNLCLSFSLDFCWLFFFLLFFSFSLSLSFSIAFSFPLSSKLYTTKKNDSAQRLWERRIRWRRRITVQYAHMYIHQMVSTKKKAKSSSFFSSYSPFRLSHFAASACIRKKKHIRSHYTTIYKRDNQVMKEKGERYFAYRRWNLSGFFCVLLCTFAITIYWWYRRWIQDDETYTSSHPSSIKNRC